MLSVGTFGGLVFQNDGQVIFPNLGNVVTEFFTYFAVNNDLPLSREKVAELFWPDKTISQSRSSLNSAIWRLNRSLKSHGVDRYLSLESGPSSLRLAFADPVQLDCAFLRQTVLETEVMVQDNSPMTVDMAASLTQALETYSDAFMPSFDRLWVLQDRERFKCHYVRGCMMMMHHYAGIQKLEQALSYGRRILKQDELRENIQRQVIWLYVMNGQRGQAIAQYNAFAGVLREELGIDPMPETQSLYRMITDRKVNVAADSNVSLLQKWQSTELGELVMYHQKSRTDIFSALARVS